MTIIGRLVGCFCVVPLTFSLLSCADGTKQLPVAPSQTAAAPRAVGTTEAGRVNLAETADVVEGISAAAAQPGSIQVTVKEKNAAVKSATVTVTCSGGFLKVGKTSGLGKITITGVPAGLKCQVTVSHTDYREQSKPVTTSSRTALLSFTITKKPTVPPKICDFRSWSAANNACAAKYPGNSNDQLILHNRCLSRASAWWAGGCVGVFMP